MDEAEFSAFTLATESLVRSMRRSGELEMLILVALKAAQDPLAKHAEILRDLRAGYVDLVTRLPTQ